MIHTICHQLPLDSLWWGQFLRLSLFLLTLYSVPLVKFSVTLRTRLKLHVFLGGDQRGKGEFSSQSVRQICYICDLLLLY